MFKPDIPSPDKTKDVGMGEGLISDRKKLDMCKRQSSYQTAMWPGPVKDFKERMGHIHQDLKSVIDFKALLKGRRGNPLQRK